MHTPTTEQQAIIDAAKGTTDNICVNALAGAAKTTTLEMICHAVTGIPILSLAFNKRIADEMAKRLPSHVEVRTLNALGHRVWMNAIGRKLVLEKDKSHKLLRMAIDELPRNRREEAYEDIADTLKWIRLAKRDGWIPKKWRGIGTALATDAWLTLQDEDMTDLQFELFESVMDASIRNAYAGEIDFDDQLYMPVCFGGQWPKFPLVLGDEVQDWSPINQAMLEKLFYKRLIIVGDPWQSIYAFRGAVSGGMQVMVAKYNMREMTLSTTFRVPKLGVERAWFRVPHMRAPDWQIDGTIKVLSEWSADDVPDSAAIICRNNAPLFTAALRLLRAGRGIKLVGMDIGAGLVRIMKKLGPPSLQDMAIRASLDKWAKDEMNKNRAAHIVKEKLDCLDVLCFHTAANNLGQAIAFAEDLFKRSGPIQLLSGHKAKGLEWDTVFHLDPWRIPSKFVMEGTEEYEQEMNVRYVVETRFKKELYLVDMKGYT